MKFLSWAMDSKFEHFHFAFIFFIKPSLTESHNPFSLLLLCLFPPVIFLSIRQWSFYCPSLFSSPPSVPPSPSVMSKASSRTLWWWAPTSGYGTCSRPRLAMASAESPSQTTAKWAASWWASSPLETLTSWRRRTMTCHWVRWVDLRHKTEATKSTVILMLYSCFSFIFCVIILTGDDKAGGSCGCPCWSDT